MHVAFSHFEERFFAWIINVKKWSIPQDDLLDGFLDEFVDVLDLTVQERLINDGLRSVTN